MLRFIDQLERLFDTKKRFQVTYYHASKLKVVCVLATIALLLGLGLRSQHDVIFSQLDLIHGDLGDSRFVNLLLEHAWYFFSGARFQGQTYWEAPWNFYPASETLLMSEVMGGASWNYIFFRSIGLDSSSAYKMWFLSTSSLNFFAAFLMARVSGLKLIGSIVTAWIFAFSLIRGAFLGHPQLICHYFSAFAFSAGVLAYNTRRSAKKSCFFGLTAGLCLGLQFWSSFYLMWFSVFTLLVASLMGLLIWRSIILKCIWEVRLPVVAFVAGFGFSAGYLTFKYLGMQAIVGARQWSDIVGLIPKFGSILLPPPDSWTYNWLFQRIHRISHFYSEMFMFPGFICLAFVGYGIWRARYKGVRPAEFCILLWLVLMVVTQHEIWKLVFYTIPGASAIRATGRIALAGLLPLSLSIGYYIDNLQLPKILSGFSTRFVGSLLLLLILLDNLATPSHSYSVADSSRRIGLVEAAVQGRDCKVFHYAASDTPWKVEIDAMWASIRIQIPTINGYSGNLPKGYQEAGITDGMNLNLERFKNWLARHEVYLNDNDICIVKNPAAGG